MSSKIQQMEKGNWFIQTNSSSNKKKQKEGINKRNKSPRKEIQLSFQNWMGLTEDGLKKPLKCSITKDGEFD